MSAAAARDSDIHGTTVLCVRKEGTVIIAADGQASIRIALMLELLPYVGCANSTRAVAR